MGQKLFLATINGRPLPFYEQGYWSTRCGDIYIIVVDPIGNVSFIIQNGITDVTTRLAPNMFGRLAFGYVEQQEVGGSVHHVNPHKPPVSVAEVRELVWFM